MLDFTHDSNRRSWVDTSNDATGDFPLQNLPLGAFRTSRHSAGQIGVAIGDHVLDVRAAHARGLFDASARAEAEACLGDSLNPLLPLGRASWRRLRQRLSLLLGPEASAPQREAVSTCLVAQREVELLLPIHVGDYTDFYASIHHATNVGRMMRPDNPLLPNYKWVPIGYHGRASSLVVSGTPVRRPAGQVKPDGADAPVFAPSRRLDYELELGAYIGPGNLQGMPVPLADARDHVFGLCLVNDWSARDVQAWEYQPLGPFLSKSFATTVSPWVVTADALEPCRVAATPRPPGDPQPLPYLDSPEERASGAFDVTLEVWLSSEAMRDAGMGPMLVSRSQARDLYWTVGQLIAHHASNGCNLRPGDLLASGTVSGESADARACLLERTWRGTEPLALPNGEVRRFLEDGDEIVLRARTGGGATMGFGECRGRILPTREG